MKIRGVPAEPPVEQVAKTQGPPATSPPKPSEIPRASDRSRHWIRRAAFESALILLGLLGGLAINEWKEAHDRQVRATAALTAVRGELVSNLRLLQESNAYNRQVVSNLQRLADQHAKTIPPEAHPNGLMKPPQLVSAAWDSLRTSELISSVDLEEVVAVGRAYEAQRAYMESVAGLINAIYALILGGQSAGLSNPNAMAGVLHDFAGRGGGLEEFYRSALKLLDEQH